MYHIFIKIYAYSQLSRINNKLLINLEEQIERLVSRYALLRGEKGHYYLPSSYYESKFTCLEAACKLKHIFDKYLSYGYAILVHHSTDETNEETWLFYQVSIDNQIWLTPVSLPFFEGYAEVTSYDKLLMLKQFKPPANIITTLKANYLSQPQLPTLVAEHLTALKSGPYNVLNFMSPAGFGKKISLQNYLNNQPKINQLNYLWLNPYPALYGDYEAFKLALPPIFLSYLLNNQLLGAYHNRLAGLVTALISELKSPLINDYLIEDLKILYTIYLTEYAKALTAGGAAAIMVIENIKDFSPLTHPLLLTIFEQCQKEKILIITLNKESYANLFNLPVTNTEAVKTTTSDVNPYAAFLIEWQQSRVSRAFNSNYNLMAAVHYLLSTFDNFSLKAIYLLTLSDGMLVIEKLFKKMLLPEEELVINQAIKNFKELQIIDNTLSPRLLISEFKTAIENYLLKEVKAQLLQQVALTAYQLWHAGHYINLHFLFLLLEKAVLTKEALEVLFNYLSLRLNARLDILPLLNKFKAIEHLLFNDEEQTGFDNLSKALILRGELLSGKINQNLISDDNANNIYRASLNLELYKAAVVTAGSDSPLLIKDILFAFSKLKQPFGETLANIEMAGAFLSKAEYRKAQDYIEISQHLAESANFSYGLLVALSLEVACAFGYGNLAAALRAAAKGISLAERVGLRHKEIFFRFTQGRANFECGNYHEAKQNFEEALEVAGLYQLKEANLVITAWLGRSLGYLGQFFEAQSILTPLTSEEGLFYCAELAYLQHNYSEAYNLLKTIKHIPSNHIVITENENWADGYQLLEGRAGQLFGRKKLLHRLALAFAMLLRGKLGDSEAKSHLERLYPLSKLKPNEPFAYLYPFYISLLLEDDGVQQKERAGALNKALILLNNRASRFDNLRLQENFLHKNYWHKKIAEDFRGKSGY